MKHKRFDYLHWHRIREGSGEQTVLSLPGGVLTDFQAAEVTKPLRVACCGQQRLILADGYRWVNFAPTDKHHALMVQLDERNVPQQLYVDIGLSTGLDPDGIAFIEDLYLDVIALCDVQPDGRWHVTKTEIIDVDELEDALREGQVTPAQHDLAWSEARAVEAALRAQTFGPVDVVRGYLTDPYT
ncbi:DUF402 domain-containing protein [Deinococcus sp. PESE-13]